MLITISKVLDPDEVKFFRERLKDAPWRDGAETAGSLARHVKRNLQLDDDSEPARELRTRLLRRLARNPTFISAALPQRIYPPKFNCYRDGGTYGAHID